MDTHTDTPTTTPPVRVAVVIGSNRHGRFGPVVAEWLLDRIGEREDLVPEVLDVAGIPLPTTLTPSPEVTATLAEVTPKLGGADAFVVVTPEYNHSFPASLKNALDYLSLEWADKPAGLVTYGGVSAGLRAAAALKPVLAALRVVPVVEAVSVPFFTQFLTEDDEFVPNAELEAGAKAMLDELARLTPALQRLRQAA
jgi:NAD(P)H-dependent FMN reductase